MHPIALIILVGLAGGIAVGIQSPLASLISQRLGTLESVFIVHLGGASAALALLLLVGGSQLGEWRTLPWWALTAGVFGVVVVAAVSYTIPRVGVAAAILTVVAGQMLISTVLDHFGLLGVAPRALEPTRLLGLAVVFVGVWLTVR